MSLTAKILGDPAPDRVQRSDDLRTRLTRARAFSIPHDSDERALRVLRVLRKGPMRATEIAQRIGVSMGTINYCLTPITARGLMTPGRRGQQVFYEISDLGWDYLRANGEAGVGQ